MLLSLAACGGTTPEATEAGDNGAASGEELDLVGFCSVSLSESIYVLTQQKLEEIFAGKATVQTVSCDNDSATQISQIKTFTLTAYGEEEYAVFGSGSETVVAVTYQQWSCAPVYSTMTVSVNHGDLTASETFDICSVTAWMVQTGGGGVTVDGTLTCYNFYGISGMNMENAANPGYTLTTEIDGEKYYYAEDASGTGYLTTQKEEAWIGDGAEYHNMAVLGNCVFYQTRLETTEEKVIDGETYVFQQHLARPYKLVSEMVEAGAKLQDGYNLKGKNGIKWAWTPRYQSGWTYDTPQPTGLPYVEGCYPYGYEAGGSNPAYAAEMEALYGE